MLAGLSPARRRVVLILLAVVVLGAAALTGLLVSRAASPQQNTPVSQKPGPVLLVPGYGGGTSALQVLADRLTAEGRDATVVRLPGNGTGDLTQAAAALDYAAQGALTRTGERSVDVVGYSAGGVVARLWVAERGGAAIARRVVTLGSPHHGTTVANLAGTLAPGECPTGCRQLTTTSPLLVRLNSGDETPDSASWVSIWTTDDTTVTPPDSARLVGAVNVPVQSVCSRARVSHGELPTNPLVQQMVIAELGAGRPVPLGPGDCARLSG